MPTEAINQGIEALKAAQSCLGRDRMSLTGWDREQWDFYQRSISALSAALTGLQNARQVIESLAKYPKTPADEISVSTMRKHARDAIAAIDQGTGGCNG